MRGLDRLKTFDLLGSTLGSFGSYNCLNIMETSAVIILGKEKLMCAEDGMFYPRYGEDEMEECLMGLPSALETLKIGSCPLATLG